MKIYNEKFQIHGICVSIALYYTAQTQTPHLYIIMTAWIQTSYIIQPYKFCVE